MSRSITARSCLLDLSIFNAKGLSELLEPIILILLLLLG